MAPIRIIGLLTGMGLPSELLHSAGSDWQLRADLGLSSAETLELQLQLEQLGCTRFSLWDSHDYTLRELEQLIDAATAIGPCATAPAANVTLGGAQ